jgi:two-component system sensor histidine kinase YesM
METAKAILYRLSFKKRMLLSFTIVIIVSILATSSMSYVIATNVIQANATQQSRDTLNKTTQLLDEQLKSLLVFSLTLMISDPFRDMLSDVAAGNTGAYYADLSSLQPPFTQFKINHPAVQSILVSTPIGDFFPTNYYRNWDFSFAGSEMQRLIDQAGQRTSIWVGGHEDHFFTGKDRVISLVMKPLSQSDNVYLVINVSEPALEKTVTDNLGTPGTYYYVISRDGNYVFDLGHSTSPALPSSLLRDWNWDAQDKGNFTFRYDGDDYLVNHARLQLEPNWALLSMQSKDLLFRQVARIKWLTAIIIVSCIALAIITSNMLSTLLLRPLHSLQTVMKQVGRNGLGVRFQSKFQDEVSQVGYKFNSMLDEISDLIHELKDRENGKRRAEAKALQAQIDPHFLYNTLNTIVWKSEAGEAEETRRTIISLSRLFKLGLNQGQELTSLKNELEHVEHYLRIQTICYEDLFAYEIRCAAELLHLPILKIILQPLVENSILHGFQDYSSGGRIAVEVTSTRESLLLTVEDNGAGMDAEQLMKSLKREPEGDFAAPAASKSYALTNVYNRIKLHYGEDADIQMTSEPGVKTRVVLQLPLKGLKGDERV